MTKQIDSNQRLAPRYVPNPEATRSEWRKWRHDVACIALRLLVDGGSPLLAAAVDDLVPAHFDGEHRVICETLIRMHEAGTDLTAETLRGELDCSVSLAALDDVLAPPTYAAAPRHPDPVWMQRQSLNDFLRDLRRDEPLFTRDEVGVKRRPGKLPLDHAATTTPEAWMGQTARDTAFTLQLIEDFRAMQEGTEAMLLAALLRDDREIRSVLDILGEVSIPAPMHGSHLEILSAITTVRELGQPVTVNACIDYLHHIRRLDDAGGRAKLMTIVVLADGSTSAVDLARQVAKYSRARVNAGQEVWPVALYRWYDAADRLLYVGITENLTTRTSSHGRKSSWCAFAVRRTVVRYPDRKSAESMERWAIRNERPLFNHVHNDTPEARQRLVAYLVEHGRMDLLAPAVSRG